MKFVVTSDIRDNKLIKSLLLFFYIQSMFFLGLNVFLEADRWGLSLEEIKNKILGNEELFLDKMELLQLATQVHIELFMYSILLIMILLVFFRLKTNVGLNVNLKVLVTGILFLSILLNSVSPFLIYFNFQFFVAVKLVAFYLMTGFFLLICLMNIVFLLSTKKNQIK